MKFGTWSSKLKAVRRNLARFWPIPVVFSLILLLKVFSESPEHPEKLWEYPDVEVLYVCLLGVLSALLLFGDLFTARYATATHAFPVTRKQLFWERVLSGLVMGLIPAAFGFCVAVLYLGNLEAPILWMLYMIPCWVYGLALGSFSAVLSGSWFGAVCTAFLFSFGLPLTELAVCYVVEGLLVGLSLNNGLVSVLFCHAIRFATTIDNDPNWLTLIFAIPECLLLFALAYLFYRRRKLETAGDLIAFPWMKVVMKVFLSLAGGITLGAIFESVLGLDYDTFSLGRTLAWLIPGILLAMLAAEMIVEKTIRVFRKKQLARYALCLLLAVGISAILWFDPVGIQTRVPEQEDIVSAKISVNYQGFTAVSPEAIAAVSELHEAVIQERTLSRRVSGECYITFEYTLKSGATVCREYRLLFPNGYYGSIQIHPLEQEIAAFMNEPRWALSYLLQQELDAKSAEDLLEKRYELQSPVSIELYDNTNAITMALPAPRENMLLYHIWQDIENGTIQIYPQKYSKGAEYRISFEYRNGANPSYYNYLWLTDSSSNTWQFLDGLFL